ncbi:MAG: hypothetical protein ACLFQT_06435 [Thiohalophilus sp.]
MEKPDKAELSQAGKDALAKLESMKPADTARQAATAIPGGDPVAAAGKASDTFGPGGADKPAGAAGPGSQIDFKA